MALKNIMILTDGNEEQMQGMIRGVEALDTDHQIGIVYGTHDSEEISEVELILADLANAIVLKTEKVKAIPHHQNNPITYMDINVPAGDRETIISYIKNEYPNLVQDILKN